MAYVFMIQAFLLYTSPLLTPIDLMLWPRHHYILFVDFSMPSVNPNARLLFNHTIVSIRLHNSYVVQVIGSSNAVQIK